MTKTEFSNGVRTASDGADGFSVSFSDGRGLLCASGLRIEDIAVVDRLELMIPGLAFPFDLSGGVRGLIHHRLTLARMTLTVFIDGAERILRERLKKTDIFSLWALAFEPNGIVISAAPTDEDGARALLVRLVPTLEDNALTLLSDFPTAFGPVEGDLLRTAAVLVEAATGLRADGCRFPLPDIAQAALMHVLPARGYRLPNSSEAKLIRFEISPDRLVMEFAAPEVATARPVLLAEESDRLEALKLKETLHITSEGDRAATQGEAEHARRIFARLLNRTPDNPAVAARIGALDTVCPEIQASALNLLDDTLRRHPENRALAAVRLHAAALSGDVETERKFLEQLVDTGSDLERFTAGMRLGHLRLPDHPDEARALFARATGIRREDSRALFAAMRTAAQLADVAALNRLAPRFIAVQPDDAHRAAAHVSAGRLSWSLGDMQSAADHFERAVDADPKNIPARWGLADTLGQGSDVARTVEHLESLEQILKAADDRIGTAEALARLADIWLEKGETSLALQRLNESLAADGDRPDRRLKLARVLVKTGSPAEALREAESALKQLDDRNDTATASEAAAFLAGLYLDDFDDIEAARATARKCLKRDETNEACAKILRRALRRKGLDKVVEDTAVSSGELREIAADAALAGETEIAISLFEKGIVRFSDNVAIADAYIATCRRLGDLNRLYKAISERLETTVSAKRRAEMEIELGSLCLTHRRDPAAALCWFRQANEKVPSEAAEKGIAASVRGLEEQAERLLTEGDTEAAEMIFQAVHNETEENRYTDTLTRAETALSAGSLAEAAALAAGLALAPRKIRIRAALVTARVLAKEGERKRAVRLLEQSAPTQGREGARLLLLTATALGIEHLESPDTVTAFFRTLLGADPSDREADEALISLLRAVGEIASAAEHLAAPSPLASPERRRKASALFIEAGRDDRAAEVLESVYRETDAIEDLFLLADVLRRLGRIETLLEMLEERRNEDPRVDEMLKREHAAHTERIAQSRTTAEPPYFPGSVDRNTPNRRGLNLPAEAEHPMPDLADDEGLEEKLSSAFNRLRKK